MFEKDNGNAENRMKFLKENISEFGKRTKRKRAKLRAMSLNFAFLSYQKAFLTPILETFKA
eukprot:snap_masked-scaffold_37-processed-gene-1.0-mRNA-1 protein AED:1.00 eAED:1.00 QI:0/-1/0/0/-1/1/1/0/60